MFQRQCLQYQFWFLAVLTGTVAPLSGCIGLPILLDILTYTDTLKGNSRITENPWPVMTEVDPQYGRFQRNEEWCRLHRCECYLKKLHVCRYCTEVKE